MATKKEGGFSESDLVELEELLESLGTTIVGRKVAGIVKGKLAGKGKVQQAAPAEHRDSPAAVGLVMMTEERVCGCCKKAETLVKGIMVKYSYRGATIKKPLNTLTEVDYNRLVKTKSGSREVEEGEIQEVAKCADCSEASLKLWKTSGMWA